MAPTMSLISELPPAALQFVIQFLPFECASRGRKSGQGGASDNLCDWTLGLRGLTGSKEASTKGRNVYFARPLLGILKDHERKPADSTDCQWRCATGTPLWSREVNLDHSKSREALVGDLRSVEAHDDRPKGLHSHRHSQTRPKSSNIPSN